VATTSKDLMQLLQAVVFLHPRADLLLTQRGKNSPERTHLMHPIVALDYLVKQAQAPAFLQALMKLCKGGALLSWCWSLAEAHQKCSPDDGDALCKEWLAQLKHETACLNNNSTTQKHPTTTPVLALRLSQACCFGAAETLAQWCVFFPVFFWPSCPTLFLGSHLTLDRERSTAWERVQWEPLLHVHWRVCQPAPL